MGIASELASNPIHLLSPAELDGGYGVQSPPAQAGGIRFRAIALGRTGLHRWPEGNNRPAAFMGLSPKKRLPSPTSGTVIKPASTLKEGPHVFFRKGFCWGEYLLSFANR